MRIMMAASKRWWSFFVSYRVSRQGHIGLVFVFLFVVRPGITEALDLSYLNAQKSDVCERALGVKNTIEFLNKNVSGDPEENQYQPSMDMLEFYNLYFNDENVLKKNCSVKNYRGELQRFTIGTVINAFAANPYWLKKANERSEFLVGKGGASVGFETEVSHDWVFEKIRGDHQREYEAKQKLARQKGCVSVYKEIVNEEFESKPVYELYQCGHCEGKSVERQNIVHRSRNIFRAYVNKSKIRQYLPHTFLDFSTTCQFYGFFKPTTQYIAPKENKIDRPKKDKTAR